MKNGHVIKDVVKGSIAEELRLCEGDVLLKINKQEIKDVFDYHYLTHDEELILLVRKKDGEEWEIFVEKEYQEDLGLQFAESLMDDYRSCKNKCIFCFIDQMPPGMRETLYFKDDDARLSFLQGNYITLTNMTEEDVERICFYKLSPINISIHTTNQKLRCKMLNNRFAGNVLSYIKKFGDAGILMNGQIVLCKGYNDKEELDRTIFDLTEYLPMMQSVSVVPVGITKYREGLCKLANFTKEDASSLISQIEGWQKKIFDRHGVRMIHASDEWYLRAGLPIPSAEAYEGYPQIENGVGMVRSLTEEFMEGLALYAGDDRVKRLSLATGVLAAPIMEQFAAIIKEKFPNIDVRVYPVRNDFFGNDITVAGLLTGCDIIAQLKDKELFEYLLLPDALLRNGEPILLDDTLVDDIENALQTPVRIVQSEGTSLLRMILDI